MKRKLNFCYFFFLKKKYPTERKREGGEREENEREEQIGREGSEREIELHV